MLKLDDIKSEIYFQFRRSQMEAMRTERLGVIHVSDIIKPCMRNVIYKKVLPEQRSSTEDMKSLYFGQVVHSNSMMAKPEHHEKFLAYDYVRDEPLTREEALEIPEEDPRQLDIIYGSIDDLMKVGDKWVICDKKTTGSIDYFSSTSYGRTLWGQSSAEPCRTVPNKVRQQCTVTTYGNKVRQQRTAKTNGQLPPSISRERVV